MCTNNVYLEKINTEFPAIVFIFDYDRDMVDHMKSYKDRWFNREDHSWHIRLTLTNIKELISFAKQNDFVLKFTKDDLILVVNKLKEAEEKNTLYSDFTLPEDGDYLVYAKRVKEMRLFLVFNYNSVLVEDVKNIPGAKFISNTRRTGWEIDIDLDNLKSVIDYLDQSYVYCNDKNLKNELQDIFNRQNILSKASKAIDTKKDIVIEGLAHNLRPFQKIAVDYALQAKKLFIADDMGCVSGDTLVTIKRSGKVKMMSIENLYKSFSGLQIHFMNFDTCYYICNKKGNRIDYSRIIDVIYSGIKPVYKLTLKNGNSIKLTEDHEILTKNGYFSLGCIRTYDEICIDNFKKIDYCEIQEIEYIGEEPTYDIKVESPNNNFIGNGIVVHNCGKTIEALATFQASNSKKCLIVCPSSVKYNWLNEANKWLPKRKSVILEFNKERTGVLDTGEINILHYNMLSKIWPIISSDFDLDMAIFDESHRLISKKSQWSKTAYEISRNLEYCLLLSGTPILNRPADLVHQLNIIDRLSLFGGEWKFKKQYCGLKKTRFGWEAKGATNTKELNKKLRSSCYIRRMKTQVLTELPEKQRTYIPIELSPSDLKVYKDAQKDIEDWIIHNKEEILKFYTELSRRKRKENKDFVLDKDKADWRFKHETMLKVQKAETLMKISKLRRISAQAKIEQFVDWAEDFLKTDQKLVIFAVHRIVINKIAEKLKKHNVVLIHGDIDSKERQDNVDKFQNDPAVKVIVCNIQAGGVGITLTSSSNVAFVEFGFSIAEHLQAEDRVLRIGQTNNVNIWYFYGKDTIDYDMIEVLQEKEKIISSASDGVYTEGMFENVIKTTIAKLAARNRTKIVGKK